MFSYIWHTFFFDPIYNTLIFFVDVVPNADLGLAIIATVIVVKTVLLPLSVRAAKTQKAMKAIEPKMKEIKEEHKDDRQKQAEAMMALYKDAEISPFASILLIFIQIPIIFALYFAVATGGGVALPEINTALLYSWIGIPEFVNTTFLGWIDITGRSLILAVLAGVTQYYQIGMTLPKMEPRDPDAAPDMKDEFMRNMQVQMRYVMPIIITGVAYFISAAIALYFLISNVFGILQEFYVRRHR
jgi:YidC/Oxa1 family membrane protein insertase